MTMAVQWLFGLTQFVHFIEKRRIGKMKSRLMRWGTVLYGTFSNQNCCNDGLFSCKCPANLYAMKYKLSFLCNSYSWCFSLKKLFNEIIFCWPKLGEENLHRRWFWGNEKQTHWRDSGFERWIRVSPWPTLSAYGAAQTWILILNGSIPNPYKPRRGGHDEPVRSMRWTS